jgi:hypothetical protein
MLFTVCVITLIDNLAYLLSAIALGNRPPGAARSRLQAGSRLDISLSVNLLQNLRYHGGVTHSARRA